MGLMARQRQPAAAEEATLQVFGAAQLFVALLLHILHAVFEKECRGYGVQTQVATTHRGSASLGSGEQVVEEQEAVEAE